MDHPPTSESEPKRERTRSETEEEQCGLLTWHEEIGEARKDGECRPQRVYPRSNREVVHIDLDIALGRDIQRENEG